MRAGTFIRIGRGTSVFVPGGGLVVVLLFMSAFASALRLLFLVGAVGGFLALVVYYFLIERSKSVMAQQRLEELKGKAVSVEALVVEGRYTRPRTWGVYRVPSFRNGQRGYMCRLGNHPVRQNELVREYGAADIVMLFTSKADAEELKHLIESNQAVVSERDA